MIVKFVKEVSLKERIMNTEITIITKKAKKKTKVYVSDVWEDENIIIGWYTNRYGKLDLKQFDMNQYDFCVN